MAEGGRFNYVTLIYRAMQSKDYVNLAHRCPEHRQVSWGGDASEHMLHMTKHKTQNSKTKRSGRMAGSCRSEASWAPPARLDPPAGDSAGPTRPPAGRLRRTDSTPRRETPPDRLDRTGGLTILPQPKTNGAGPIIIAATGSNPWLSWTGTTLF